MAVFLTAQDCFVVKTKEEEEEVDRTYKNYREIMMTLPRMKGWVTQNIYQYQGFWFQPMLGLEGVMWVQQHLKPRDGDIFLISTPKSGTTWLKALIFTIINRTRYSYQTHPLLTTSPHDCVPFLELDLFKTTPIADPDVLPSPRVFATHIPFPMLSESIKKSNCRIVYICRNPKDVFVSLWHFMTKLDKQVSPIPLEEAFDLFCKGVSPYGPFWDHVLENWKASLQWPNKIIFLKYEEMKKDPLVHVKRLAEFLGHSFSLEEEEKGLIQELLKLCSFESMRDLEVNQTGAYRIRPGVKNNVFYRQGKVGDWKNHLTAEMIERVDQITEQKLSGSGLRF